MDGREKVLPGTDIDGLGGLVEHEQARGDREPLGEQHLLLVAAGQLLDQGVGGPGLDRQLLDQAVGLGFLPVPTDEPATALPAYVGQGDVVPDAHLEGETVTVAALGDERDAGLDAAHDVALGQVDVR